MFSDRIQNTPFTSSSANEFFGNIVKNYNSGLDNSFVSTLRALLYRRADKVTDRITVRYSRSSYNETTVETNSLNKIMPYALGTEMLSKANTIFVHNIDGSAPTRNALIKKIKDRFLRTYTDYEQVQKITDFFRKSFIVLCFVDRKHKNVVLFVDKLTLRKFHAIQIGILEFLPWYFDPAEKISDNELGLIKSLAENTPEKYLEALQKIFDEIDIRTEFIKRKLAGFEENYERRTMDRLLDQINDYNRAIDDYISYIAQNTKNIQEAQTTYAALKNKVDNPSNEVMDYFLHNKSLVLDSADNTSMTFSVKGYLTYFDEEYAKTLISDRRSSIYEYASHPDDFKLLMTAIFLDQTLRIKMCGTFKIILGDNVSAVRGADYSNSEYADYTPNPHLYHHACLGNNREPLAQAVKANNVIGMIEQCCAAAQQLNFYDPTVVGEFVYTMCGRDSINTKCIELPDGTVVKPEAAIAWLKEQKGETDE